MFITEMPITNSPPYPTPPHPTHHTMIALENVTIVRDKKVWSNYGNYGGVRGWFCDMGQFYDRSMGVGEESLGPLILLPLLLDYNCESQKFNKWL